MTSLVRQPDARSQSREQLVNLFAEWQQPAYRVDQLQHWLYTTRATSWEQMTNLSRPLREKLAATFTLALPELVRKQGSHDTTQKFLWRLFDGQLIESVLIPASPALYGDVSDRHTLCVSTQVGCAYGCQFCASGLAGYKRNLTPDEIIGQVLAVERWHSAPSTPVSPAAPAAADLTLPPVEQISNLPVSGVSDSGRGRSSLDETDPEGNPTSLTRMKSAGLEDPACAEKPARDKPATAPSRPRLINNLVIMGMGEPLANYDHLLTALRILNAPWGGSIGARKITISTSGLAPQIRQLAEEPLQFRLAISLHGATDIVRSKIMPINRKYPLAELTAACEYHVARKGKMMTLEYILIAGINDSLDQTAPLARLARRLHAKVNLIPYNTVEGLPWSRPTEEVCERFLQAILNEEISATLRREKGHDIDAACGQLRLKTEQQLAQASGARLDTSS